MRGQPNTMKLNTAIEYGAASLLILVTLLCIFTPEPILFKQFAAYTLYIMLGLLGAGLLFFVFNQNRLMMVSLLCCCGLNLYLKDRTVDSKERRKFIEDEITFTDATSGKRTAKFILKHR